METSDLKIHNKYVMLVNEAKSCIDSMARYRVRVCKLALEACEIRVGGHRGKGYYTLARFAEDIGIGPKTLNDWLQAYQNVIKPLGIKDPSNKEFGVARLMHEENTKTIRSMGKRELKAGFVELLDPHSEANKSRKMRKIISNMKYFTKNNSLKSLSKKDQSDMLDFIDHLIGWQQ